MLILLTILVLAVAASAFIYFFNKRNFDRQLETGEFGALPETTNLRPLFEPTPDELRADAIEAEKNQKADEDKESGDLDKQRAFKFRSTLSAFRTAPSKGSIAALLELAVDDGTEFADAAEAIADQFRKGRIENLSIDDLAQMLESHFWLVPAEQRTPSMSYRFRTALESLRTAFVIQ